jgi:hypothetical protein
MKTLICLFLWLLCFQIHAQTRIFISAGTNSNTEFTGGPSLNLGLTNNSISTGSYTTDPTFGRYLCLDLSIEKRLYGPYYWLSGIKINQTGYDHESDDKVYTSAFKSTYVSLPLLARINFYNSNTMYLDFGFIQNCLVSADLKESFFDIYAHQNITRHLSRFSTSFYFELTFAYRRLGLSAFFQSKTFGSSSNFSDEWGLDYNRSFFLLYYRNFYFKNVGVKLCYRLR